LKGIVKIPRPVGTPSADWSFFSKRINSRHLISPAPFFYIYRYILFDFPKKNIMSFLNAFIRFLLT
jgi:hypothetical protein